MIAIIDYGLGNVRAFANVYMRLNIPVTLAKQAKDLKHADKIILPGVGAFDYAMELLDKSGLRGQLDEMVFIKKVPILGICVGMQMLAKTSEEGERTGLGWIDAEVRKFKESSTEAKIRIPHMGWNNIKPTNPNKLLDGLNTESIFYFLHSYYFKCNNLEDVIAVSDYQIEFACAITSGNIYGVQFHPEKSHMGGARLLENFARL